MPRYDDGKPKRSEGAAAQNERSTSTTWEWRRVRVQPLPAAGQHSAPKALRWYRLPPWKRREWLHLRVRYRGGNECWIEVEARGQHGRFEGSTALFDAFSEIWGISPSAIDDD